MDEFISSPATRRTVVKTGAKLAYAAPLVAATMTLSAHGALAGVSGYAGTCTATSGQDCDTYVPCGTTSRGNPCVCARAGDNTVCSAYGSCAYPCDSDADCANVIGAYGDVGPGYCHTTTCCDTQGKRGACAPFCL